MFGTLRNPFIYNRAIFRTLTYLDTKASSNGLVVKALDSRSGAPCSKPLGGSKVESAVHPSDVDKMSTRDSWQLSGKK